jgi:hypothetical protein
MINTANNVEEDDINKDSQRASSSDQNRKVVDLLQSLLTERHSTSTSAVDDNRYDSSTNEDQHDHIREVGIIIDNAGYEIVSDLLLVVYKDVADQINFHVT